MNTYLRQLKLDCRGFDDTIEFAQGVNVIVGESDSGKSNIVRSLELLIDNGPAKPSLTPKHERLEVEASFRCASGDIKIVALAKSEAKTRKYNLYRLTTTNGRGQLSGQGVKVYKNVGLTVPQAVAEYLNMGSVTIAGAKVSLNIQKQRDAVLIVDHSPSQVAKLIGSISGFDAVYRAMDEASKLARKASTAASHARIEVVRARDRYLQEKHKFDDKAVAASIGIVNTTIVEADAIESKIGDTRAAARDLVRAHRVRRSFSVAGVASAVESLVRVEQTIERLKDAVDTLQDAMRSSDAVSRAGNVCPACGQEIVK